MISINGHKLNVTRFPDKTSQVWKQPDGLLKAIEKDSELNIHWEFEDEYELLHIFQLLEFVSRMKIKSPADQMIIWHIPYMPYARQDKDISNTSCWALHFITGMLAGVGCELHTFDVHNPSFFEQYPEIKLINVLPTENIEDIVKHEAIDLLIFPDEGAGIRYSQLSSKEFVVANKIREESTGIIQEITVPEISVGKSILVVDDICDGGRTFIDLGKVLEQYKPSKLILYVSHGIFSQGLEALGYYYKQIYTRKGPVFNG